MIIKKFAYQPSEHEAEKASNSYLMTLIAIIAGLPLPIVNLIATGVYYLANRKGTYFVRWHATQALVSQASIIAMNSFGFWWTVSIILGEVPIDNNFIAYLFTVFAFNLFDFILTIYSAIQTRKGIHVEWWFYGQVTHYLCKP